MTSRHVFLAFWVPVYSEEGGRKGERERKRGEIK
jgi:hypothetical protein